MSGEGLPGVTIADVKSALAGETDGQVIKRLIAVWEVLDGQSPAAIEAKYTYPEGTVDAWLELVGESGLAALSDAQALSRPDRAVGDRKRLANTETKLRSLQEITRELMTAATTDDIVDLSLTACVDVLGMPISVFWLYDDERDVLIAYRQTEYGYVVMGTLPPDPFERGEGIVWRAVESGQVRYWDDLWDLGEELYNPDTDLRSEIDVPLGEYGVLGMGSMSPAEFDEADVDMCRILGRAVESAFKRADRERALEYKTEQLEAMAEVVSHDLRTPLDVGATRLRLLDETLADAPIRQPTREAVDDHVASIEAALDRASEIAGELLSMTGNASVSEPTAADIRTVATTVWEMIETGDLDLEFRGSRTVEADDGQLRHVFENCIRNVVDHADATCVRIGATTNGFFVEDDGDGIPADRRNRVAERGFTTTAEGNGLGLAIVDEIAADHGWEISITEGRDGGARIEVTTER